mgnify:CR=1 FL=1
MTQRERQILKWIEENPLISQQELADKAGIARSSVAVHISNLMKQGHIAGKGYIVRTAPYVVVVGGVNLDIGGRPHGELVAAGQKLFTLVNTDDIWLNARIEETRIGQIRVGQDVTFTIDGYPGRTFSGRIYEINPAACSVFSLISTENVAGYFTKIMQRVPVKISLPRLDSPETDPGEPEVVFRIGMQGTIEIQL